MSILIIIVLVLGGVVGYRRGLSLQVLHTLGTFSAIVIAALNYELLASRLDMILPYPAPFDESPNPMFPEFSDPEQSFYKMGAFVIIFIIAKVVIQIIVSAFDYLQQLPILGMLGNIVSAAIGVIEFLYILVVLLFMIALVPVDMIEDFIDTPLVNTIVHNTFMLSGNLKNWIQ